MSMTPHQLWNNACKYDGLPSISTVASFSDKNPWAKRYDKVAKILISADKEMVRGRRKKGSWDIREKLHIVKPGDNAKLGDMASIALPEGPPCRGGTCTGSSKYCKLCYGNKGAYAFVKALGKDPYSENLGASKHPDFVSVMVDELGKWSGRGKKMFRVHPKGDLYDEEYIEKWDEIAEQSPDTKFGIYTRSWRVPKLQKSLRKFSALPNVKLMASTDPTSGKPPDWLPEAGIGGTYGKPCKVCTCKGGEETCAKCGHCYDKSKGGVTLYPHSILRKDLPQLNDWEQEALAKGGWKRDKDEEWKLLKGRLIVPEEYNKEVTTVRKAIKIGAFVPKSTLERLGLTSKGTWSGKRTTSKVSRIR
jgi:hypothetical protein